MKKTIKVAAENLVGTAEHRAKYVAKMKRLSPAISDQSANGIYDDALESRFAFGGFGPALEEYWRNWLSVGEFVRAVK